MLVVGCLKQFSRSLHTGMLIELPITKNTHIMLLGVGGMGGDFKKGYQMAMSVYPPVIQLACSELSVSLSVSRKLLNKPKYKAAIDGFLI